MRTCHAVCAVRRNKGRYCPSYGLIRQTSKHWQRKSWSQIIQQKNTGHCMHNAHCTSPPIGWNFYKENLAWILCLIPSIFQFVIASFENVSWVWKVLQNPPKILFPKTLNMRLEKWEVVLGEKIPEGNSVSLHSVEWWKYNIKCISLQIQNAKKRRSCHNALGEEIPQENSVSLHGGEWWKYNIKCVFLQMERKKCSKVDPKMR